MKIVPKGNGVFEFHLDVKFVTQSKNFVAAKTELLSYVEREVDRELERMFVEFNKKYEVDLDKDSI